MLLFSSCVIIKLVTKPGVPDEKDWMQKGHHGEPRVGSAAVQSVMQTWLGRYLCPPILPFQLSAQAFQSRNQRNHPA